MSLLAGLGIGNVSFARSKSSPLFLGGCCHVIRLKVYVWSLPSRPPKKLFLKEDEENSLTGLIAQAFRKSTVAAGTQTPGPPPEASANRQAWPAPLRGTGLCRPFPAFIIFVVVVVIVSWTFLGCASLL